MIYKIKNGYYVRGLNELDLEGPYISWFEDQEVCKFNSHGKLINNKQYFRDYVLSSGGMSEMVWAICNDVDGHIGNISLKDISLVNRSAELSIILGNKNHHGCGVGLAASFKILSHAFKKLNLHRVYCGTAATNVAMCKLALSLGMIKEGCRRQQLWLDGAWVDVVEFGILVSEFEEITD